MPTFNNNESGSSVRTKINAAITTVDSLDSGDNLLMDAAERSKLAAIESGATADQTDAEIKTAYENNSNTNAFTDAEQTKLGNISVTQAVNLDTMESDIAINNAKVGVTTEEANPDVVSQAEAEAGTATTERIWTAQRVAQAIAALETGGSGGVSASSGSGAPSSTPSSVGDLYIDTTNDVGYIATGTASSADWDELLTSASGSTLTTATSVGGDFLAFFDTSDSGNPKQTTITNFINDNSIVVDGDIGTSVQAFDADTLKADVADTLTVGFNSSDFAGGTQSSGTYTPDPADGNFQQYTNGGAHTLAVPASSCSIVIQITNNGSAGAITTSGYTQVTGDSLTTTDGDDFMCVATRCNGFTVLNITALQ